MTCHPAPRRSQRDSSRLPAHVSSATKASLTARTLFAADIQRKAKGEADRAVVETVAAGAAPLVEWLADRYGLPFDVIDNFNYPGHSAMRMHGLPSRTGRELIDRLRSAAEANDIVILAKSTAQRLFADSESRIRGVEVARRDGSCERIGCGDDDSRLQRVWRKSGARPPLHS